MEVVYGTGIEDAGAEDSCTEDAGGVGDAVSVAAASEEALDSEAATGQ